MKKSIVGVSILIVGIICVVLFVMPGKNDKEGILKIISDTADLQVKDFHYTEVGDSDVVWEINADKAQYFKKESHASFINVRVKLITSDGKIYFMTGDKGRLNTETKDIEVNGNVVVTSDSNERFESDDIRYVCKDKRIFTDSPVAMENQAIKVKGRGLSILIKDKRLALLSHVRATIVNWQK